MDPTHEFINENCTEHEPIEMDDKLAYVNDWFLMSSPVPVSLIVLSYLLFVLKIGPAFMKNRNPFKLKNTLLIYNIIQVAISCGLLRMCLGMISKHGLIPQTCVMETEANRLMTTTAIYYYLSAKVTELMDTVLFVLRKKDNQVTFLHVYHHSFMVMATWSALKYDPTFIPVFLGTFNSFVHVLMYTYYGLSSYPSLAKYLWWKKYITTIQLIQFVTILIHFFTLYATSDCTPSKAMTFTMAFNGSLFIFMFGKFYVKTYSKKSKVEANNGDPKAKLNGVNEKLNNTNGNLSGVGKTPAKNTIAYVSSLRAVNRKYNAAGNR